MEATGPGLIDAISDSVKLIGNWNSLSVIQDEIISSTGEIGGGGAGFFGSGFNLDFQQRRGDGGVKVEEGHGFNNNFNGGGGSGTNSATLASFPPLLGESADLVYTDLSYVNLNGGGGGRKGDQSIIRVPAVVLPVSGGGFTNQHNHVGALNKHLNLNNSSSSFSNGSLPATTPVNVPSKGILLDNSSSIVVEHNPQQNHVEDLENVKCPSPSFSETFSFLSDCSDGGLISMKNSNNNTEGTGAAQGGNGEYVKAWIIHEPTQTTSFSLPPQNSNLTMQPPPPPPPPTVVKNEVLQFPPSTTGLTTVTALPSPAVQKCSHCSKAFDNPLTLEIHMRLHTGERPYACKICGEDFIHHTYLDYHMANTHGIIGNNSSNIADFNQQNNQNSTDKPKKKKKKKNPDDQTANEPGKATGNDNNNDLKPYKCQYCVKSFKHSSWLIMHIRTHTGEKPFKCHHCTMAYTQRGSLVKHLLTHGESNKDAAAAADSVAKALAAAAPVVAPVPYVNNAATSSVPQPGLGSNNLTLRRIQKKKKKGSSEGKNGGSSEKVILDETETDINQNEKGKRPVKCTICKAKFPQRKALVSHMKLHNVSKPFSCTECSKKFRQVTRLHKHMREIHNITSEQLPEPVQALLGSEPFHENFSLQSSEAPPKICDISGSSKKGKKKKKKGLSPGKKNPNVFANKPADFHASDKGHKCTICNKVLLTTTNLTVHMRIHTGEKPYQCSFCQKSFSVQSNLKAHVRTHTGEKPYQCSLCNTGFATRGNFTSHLRAHGVNPYKCSLCNDQFTFSWKLKDHMMTAHNKKMKAENKVLLT